MLRKAWFRCALYALVLVSTYSVLQVLARPNPYPWRSHRLVYSIYADSVTSTEFRVIDASDPTVEMGVLIAVVNVQVMESPVYFQDEFAHVPRWGKRIEIGRKVEVRPGFNFKATGEGVSNQQESLQSYEFVRDSILDIVDEGDLTPAMESTIRKSATLRGTVIDTPRVVLTFIAMSLWALMWFALIFELISARIRRKKNRHRYFNDLCFRCDYQLTRDMHQCPECGRQINWRSYIPKARV